jgi:hypothetical protein
MVRKTIVTLVDDLTGEAVENISTVEFALDGRAYELDLTDETVRCTMRWPVMSPQRESSVGGVAGGPAQAKLSTAAGAALATTARR